MSASEGDEQVVVGEDASPGHPVRQSQSRGQTQSQSHSQSPSPTQKPKRRWHWRLIAFLTLIALVYVAVISLYAWSGRVESTGENPAPPPGGVTVLLTQQAVNASAETMSMMATLQASPELQAGDATTLAQDVHIIISPVSGEQAITFAKGTIPGTQNVNLLSTGAIENWPFDTYTSPLVVIAYIGAEGNEQAVPTNVDISGYLPGWRLSNTTVVTHEITVVGPDGDIDWPTFMLTANRSGSTVAFGIVLLSLLVAMPVLVLFVAITAYLGRRKVEASFMSWMGAMLFATIPLRTFLPGSPPIGSWIDFLIVLWVIAGLVAGLIIYVRAWVRWGTPSIPPPVPPSIPPPDPTPTSSKPN
ncbi:DUF4436 family protein [Subtercola lobariae]|uniref:DUF4436 domain-containing protein n=1 Tax=Subtercola lobariae TaxID=1588641 RepID=A0A917B875_9MICO|nr:DUF4436 family protein [Subtercola lobariae]GGF29183.1 DUF4436 domain-containing protein [Subtercola lobariae]